jgi:hypothetical protein
MATSASRISQIDFAAWLERQIVEVDAEPGDSQGEPVERVVAARR